MSKIARLSLSVATAAVKTAGTLAGYAFEKVRDHLPGSDDDGRSERFSSEARTAPAPTPPPPSPEREAAPVTSRGRTSVDSKNGSSQRARAGTAAAMPQPPAPTSPPPPSAATDHVSREAVEVASVGPADTPGPSIQVRAPWDDYDGLPAAEIVSRVRGADAATAAAVALYEGQKKGRRTILDAAAKAG